MSSSEDNSAKVKFNKTKTNEEIILEFQKLRSEHRFLFNKLIELELDVQEHRVVINTLKDVDHERKCFRLIGGVLCERTIKDVIPILKTNEENMKKLMESYSSKLKAKEEEIEVYKEEFNLRFKPDETVPSNESENKAQESHPRPSGNENSRVVVN